jgi:hypothetical protein
MAWGACGSDNRHMKDFPYRLSDRLLGALYHRRAILDDAIERLEKRRTDRLTASGPVSSPARNRCAHGRMKDYERLLAVWSIATSGSFPYTSSGPLQVQPKAAKLPEVARKPRYQRMNGTT